MTCSLDFVDSIDASPTVRLALAAGPTWIINADETDFSPPPIREAVAQTLLTDGGVVPSAAYDFRRIRLGLFLSDDTPDDTATALQALYRELDRPGGNILRWHEHTTNPVFLRTFRASASSVRHLGRDGRRKRISVDLRAEPFGYGLREDPVVAATVSADPAAGSNGCFVDVTGVKGDVETPALIRWPESAVSETRQSLFAVRRRGTPSQLPFLFQAEAMGQGADTTTQANDANFSGAGNNYSRCTFSTNVNMVPRLSLTDLGTASVDLRGTYRVFLRYRKNTSGDGISLRLEWGPSIVNDTLVTPNTTNISMAELGLISVPFGIDPVYDFISGTELVVDDAFQLTLSVQRTSGSGSIDLDCLLLVPVDDRLAIVEWMDEGSGADRHWLDARDSSVHARNSSDEIVAVAAPKLVGGLPMLSPGQTNRIYALYEVAQSRLHAIATTTDVSVSYFPRYLTVRPAST